MLGLGSSITSSGALATAVAPSGNFLWQTSDFNDYTISGQGGPNADTLAIGTATVDGISNYVIITQTYDGGFLGDPVMTLKDSSDTFDVAPSTFSTGQFIVDAKFLMPSSSDYDGAFVGIFDGNTVQGTKASVTNSQLSNNTWVSATGSCDATGTDLIIKIVVEDPGAGPESQEQLYVTDVRVRHSDGTLLYRRGPAF